MAYELEILGDKINNPKGEIVFIHGICHGAWCWKYFLTYFSDAGYQCYAVSLRGHSNSEGKEDLDTFTLSDYVADVESVVADCNTKPFLVGHSMGGAVVQWYIRKNKDTVQGAVLLAPATAPHMGIGEIIPKNKYLWCATRIAWDMYDRSNISGKRKKIVQNAAFFISRGKNGEMIHRIEDTSCYETLLQPESLKITSGVKTSGGIKIKPFGDLTKTYAKKCDVHIPVFVIGSRADLYFPQKSLEKTANAHVQNGKTALVILEDLCHDMMLDPEWKVSAKPILDFIEDPITFVNKPENHWPR